MTPEEVRIAGHQLIDWIADYRRDVAERPVMARTAPGEIRAALPGVELVLVGAAEPYGALGLRAIADEPAGIGPLGGLGGLLSHAGSGQVLALACDLPRLESQERRSCRSAAGRRETESHVRASRGAVSRRRGCAPAATRW